jgi:Tol biopolymer transport system component
VRKWVGVAVAIVAAVVVAVVVLLATRGNGTPALTWGYGPYRMTADGSAYQRLRLPHPTYESPYVAWSPDWRWRFVHSMPDGGRWQVYIERTDGTRRGVPVPGSRKLPITFCGGVVWSPDSTKIAYNVEPYECYAESLTTFVFDRRSGRRVSVGPFASFVGAWSPDSRRLLLWAMSVRPYGHYGFYITRADGSAIRRLRVRPTPHEVPKMAWSRDGTIFFVTQPGDSGGHLFAVTPNGGRARNLTPQFPKVAEFALSPDGSRIAFVAPGRPDRGWEIFVMRRDGSGVRRLLPHAHSASDEDPAWTPDGRRVVFSRWAPNPWNSRPALYVMKADGTGMRRVRRLD